MEKQCPGPYERRVIYQKARGLLCDLNAGSMPVTIWDWRRLYRRFDITIHVSQPSCLVAPMMFWNSEEMIGTLFVPRTRDRRRLHRWLIHELLEILMDQEICSKFVYPCVWGDHHALAKIIDEVHAQRFLL